MDTIFTKNRNLSLDIYKGILIILVVIRHVLQFSVVDEGGFLTNLIWAVQMPGFMLVSGYFAAKNCCSFSELRKTVIKSLQRYAVPFLSWFILVNVLIFGNYERNVYLGIESLFQRVDRGLWFLWVIFILSIFAAIANLVNGRVQDRHLKWILSLLTIIGCMALLVAVGLITDINYLGIKLILYYSVFYMFGWLVHKTEDFWKPYYTTVVRRILVSFCTIVFAIIIFNVDLYNCKDTIINIIIRITAGFCGSFILYHTICCYSDYLRKCNVHMLGKYTLEIYTTHMCVNALFRNSNSYVFGTLFGFGNFFVSLICTTFFTFIIIAVLRTIPICNFLLYGKRLK